MEGQSSLLLGSSLAVHVRRLKNINNICNNYYVIILGKISCPQTGYNATIEFKTKPFFSNEQNKVIAEVFPPNIKKSILKVYN